MKSFKTYIAEAFKISKNTKQQNYNYFPKTKDELEDIIKQRIESEGNKCNLNDIDVNKITSMDYIFNNFRTFNGDISKWDVSNVTTMKCMFFNSKFNGDISNWNVSNVENMCDMFHNSIFNKDISNWDVSNVKNMTGMFLFSKFNRNISKWNVSNVKYMRYMFASSKFNQDISNWQLNKKVFTKQMFETCPIEEKYKPKFK